MPSNDAEKRWYPGCLAGLGALFALFAGLGVMMAACANSISNLAGSFAVLGGPPTPPSTVPVPLTSCPYLERVQLTATDAGNGWLDPQLTDATHWPAFSARVAPKLDRFDLELHRAVTHVPRPVASKLHEVIEEVEIGRVELPRASSGADYATLTHDAVTSGYLKLLDASNLVGTACGFTLAPDAAIALADATAPG